MYTYILYEYISLFLFTLDDLERSVDYVDANDPGEPGHRHSRYYTVNISL